ncbi:MAG: PAS domain-containing protein [Alphaproteobacteria bacterium]|nr:MAG: PAS domain-containing protein [Alphaproteobacteria bacterium]
MLSPFAAAALALFCGAWLAAALALIVRASRRSADAAARLTGVQRAEALLAAAPAVPVVVRRNGVREASPQAAGLLGLDSLPSDIAHWAQDGRGLSPEDAQALAERVAAASAGAAFALHLRPAGGARVLLIRGGPAPAAFGPGSVLLWISDATDGEERMTALLGEAERSASALEALSALIEAAPFPMWHRGPDLGLAMVNGAYVEAVEAQSALAVVEGGMELVDDNPRGQAAAVRDQAEPVARTVPATIAGERRMMRIVEVPLGPSGVAGYAIDVEDREQAKADLARFVRAQRDMLDRLSAGVAQFGRDRSLIFSNQPFARMFSLRPDFLTESPEFNRLLDAMREAGNVPEVRDYPEWKRDHDRWFTGALAAEEEDWLLSGGKHLRVVAQPLPDGGLLLIFEDRTEQLQLASARDTLLRVRTATFDNLFEAVGVFASDGRLNLWNNRFRELVRSATVERKQRSGRVSLVDGREFEFAAVPLPDGNALFTMLDVTASRTVEAALRERTDALEEADRVKTAFVSNMSYELRTPLTSIAGFAEMLSAGYGGELPATAVDYVGAIMESVARLGALIDNVLDLTQSDVGSLLLAEEDVDLAALCQEVADGCVETAVRKGIDLAVEIDPKVGRITGDRRRLGQAIGHILSNAFAYSEAGGRVLLHAAGPRGRAEITVSDNGRGIPTSEQARVFDRFHRSDTAEGEDALGLGLPLAKQFVEAHGGSVKLVSEPGEGTTVTIRLPRTPQRA